MNKTGLSLIGIGCVRSLLTEVKRLSFRIRRG